MDRLVMTAVRRAHIAPLRFYTQSSQPHDPRHFLVVHDEPSAAQLKRHTPIAVARELVLDVFDQGDDFRVRWLGLRGHRAIVEGAARQVHGLAPLSDRAARGPLITKDLSLPFAVSTLGVFSDKIKLHRQLTYLPLERGDASFILGDDARLCFLVIQFAPIKLRQPQVDEVGGDLVRALRIPPADHPGADVLAELQLERRRMPTVGTS